MLEQASLEKEITANKIGDLIMGVLDKFLDAIKVNDEFDDDEFLDDDFDDDFEDEKPKRRFFKKLEEEEDDLDDYEPERRKKAEKQPAPKTSRTAAAKAPKQPQTSSKVTPMRSTKRSSVSMEVCVIKPTNMEDTREIADTLIANCTVILNLEGLDMEVAQRIIDFTSGSCYSIGGSLQKVSSYIFILTPANVDITGDYQQILNGAFDIPSIRTEY